MKVAVFIPPLPILLFFQAYSDFDKPKFDASPDLRGYAAVLGLLATFLAVLPWTHKKCGTVFTTFVIATTIAGLMWFGWFALFLYIILPVLSSYRMGR